MSNNIDPNEIAKFSNISDWWDPDSSFRLLHEINPIRLNFIQQATRLNGKTVLDVGCGGGILSESLARDGAKVTGIDMNESALQQAKAHAQAQHLDIDYQLCSIEELAEQKKQFDIITCMELLEHVPNPYSIIEASAKLIKPGGELFYSTVNRNMTSYVFAIVFAEYILRLLPQNTHEYGRFIRPSELASWLRQNNLLLIKLQGAHYNPLTHEYKFSNSVDINYLVYAKAMYTRHE